MAKASLQALAVIKAGWSKPDHTGLDIADLSIFGRDGKFNR